MKLKSIALALLVFTGTIHAGELPNGPHIVTSGKASIDAIPDMATLVIEVNTQEKNAAAAKKLADDRVAQYLTFLQKNGVQQPDIKAANLRTEPDYDYQNGKATLKGYRAIRNVEVTVRQLDNLDNLLNGALKAGLHEIRSLTPGVSHPDQYREKARKAAVADAVTKSKQLAQELNSTLGPVYSIRYHASRQPAPIMRTMAMNAQSDGIVAEQNTYHASIIQFNDQVEVVFEITPDKDVTAQ